LRFAASARKRLEVPSKFLLVIPVYKERDRLPRFLPRLAESLTRSGLDVRLLLVDDGSGPEQQKWLDLYVDDLRRRYPIMDKPLMRSVNEGKGAVVYAGWQTARAEDWVGFVDADGAVSAEEVIRLMRIAEQNDEAAGVFGVRTGEEGTTVRREFKRKLSGNVFRFLVQTFFKFPVPDTQCGCKWVRRPDFEAIADSLTELRYCFDVELTSLLFSQGKDIVSVPISWEESPGSRLGPGSVVRMAASLLRLRKRLGPYSGHSGSSVASATSGSIPS
jgi:glycosyltransferase involved in cell wall biosynthesis